MNNYIYRVTKFNPLNRDSSGRYLEDRDWISISDIGKTRYRNLSYKEYKVVEDAYVNAVFITMKDKAVKSFKIEGLGNYNTFEDFQLYEKQGYLKDLNFDFQKDIKNLKNGQVLSGSFLI